MMNLGTSMSMPSGQMGMPMSGGMMVPQCMMKMEKCTGGMKITCTCEDATAAAMMQNLCKMMMGGMCGCCVMMNGMMVCNCNLMMGMCKMQMTEMGMTMTCTSGDATCAKMIQACCDCMMEMMMPGATACLTMNGMPMCCCVC
jgi:hypothetical protein